MYERYKEQRIKEIQDMFHCSEERAIGVFHELPESDFEKWKNKQKLNPEELQKIFDSISWDEVMNEFTKTIIASGLITTGIGLFKKITKE